MKTQTITPADFRKIIGLGDRRSDARVEPDGSVWLCIPGIPVSLNKWMRQHWAVTRRMLLEMTANMRALKVSRNLPVFERAEVEVVYYFPTSRRRDQDNYAPKQLLDSMRKAGIIADDNDQVLNLLPVRFAIDREPRTEIWVRKWEGRATN